MATSANYSFVGFNELDNVTKDTYLDVIGVCKGTL